MNLFVACTCMNMYNMHLHACRALAQAIDLFAGGQNSSKESDMEPHAEIGVLLLFAAPFYSSPSRSL